MGNAGSKPKMKDYVIFYTCSVFILTALFFLIFMVVKFFIDCFFNCVRKICKPNKNASYPVPKNVFAKLINTLNLIEKIKIYRKEPKPALPSFDKLCKPPPFNGHKPTAPPNTHHHGRTNGTNDRDRRPRNVRNDGNFVSVSDGVNFVSVGNGVNVDNFVSDYEPFDQLWP